MNNIKKTRESIFKKIDELKTRVIDLSQEIDAERKDSNEEDTAVKQDLIAKREILQQQIYDLQEALKDSENANNGYGQAYTLEINGNKRNITIVHPTEANPSEGLISAESPLAKAVMGKASGDNVDVETPVGVQSYRLV